jgi:hypothetical protein
MMLTALRLSTLNWLDDLAISAWRSRMFKEIQRFLGPAPGRPRNLMGDTHRTPSATISTPK